MDRKLDELLSSITALKQDQADNQKAMRDKLKKLKRDIHAGQDVAVERVVKKLKRDRGYEFKDMRNNTYLTMTSRTKYSAAALLAKVTPANPKDKEALDNAAKELKEGVDAILLCQKLIHLANHSKYSRPSVI